MHSMKKTTAVQISLYHMKFDIFPAKFYGWWNFFLKVGFQAQLYIKLSSKFPGDRLTYGWDTLARDESTEQKHTTFPDGRLITI